MKKTRKILISMFALGLALRNVAYAASGESSSDGFPIKYIFMGIAFLVIVLLLFLGYKMDVRSTETYVAPKKSKKSSKEKVTTPSAQKIETTTTTNDDIVFPDKAYVDENEESLFASAENEEDYQGFTTAESLKASKELDEELNNSTFTTYNDTIDSDFSNPVDNVIVEDEATDNNTEEIDNTLIMENNYMDNSATEEETSNNLDDIEPISNVIDEVEPISNTINEVEPIDNSLDDIEPISNVIDEVEPIENPIEEINPITENSNNDEYGEEFDTSIIDGLDDDEEAAPPRAKNDDTIMFDTEAFSSATGNNLNDEIDALDDIDNDDVAKAMNNPILNTSNVVIPNPVNNVSNDIADTPVDNNEPEEYYDDDIEDESVDTSVPETTEPVIDNTIPDDNNDDVEIEDDDYYEEVDPLEEKEVTVEEKTPEPSTLESFDNDTTPGIEYTDPVDIDFGILDEDDDTTTNNTDSFAEDLKKFDEPAEDFAGFTVAAKEEPVEPKTKPKRFTRMMPKEFTTNKETAVTDEEITDDDIEDNTFYENDFLKQMEENFKNNDEFEDDDDDNKF